MDEKVENQEAEGTAEGQAEGQAKEGEAKEGEAKEKETSVPMERFEEIQTKLKAQEDANKTLQQQVTLINANTAVAQRPAQPQFDIYKEVGLDPDDPDDVPTQAQLKKINEYHISIVNARLADNQFLLDNPDFPQLVGTAEQIRTRQFAAPLMEALTENPALAQMLAQHPNPRIAAYSIAKLHQQHKEAAGAKTKKVTKKEAKDVIDEAVENAKRTKSSANVKGGSALSEEGRIANMDDAAFVELARKHGATI